MGFLVRIVLPLLIAAPTLWGRDELPLRPIGEIREGSLEAVDGRTLVRVRGVVTLVMEREALVIQDATDAIYAHWPRVGRDIQAGDEVEVTARIAAGRFAPLLRVESVRRFGTAPLPTPVPAELGELLTGRYDCRRVVVRGVGRKVRPPDEHTRLTRVEVATANGPFIVLVEEEGGLTADAVVDAQLEITGCCFAFFNPRGESTGVNLRVKDAGGVKILLPPPADPFAVPEILSVSLRPFRRGGPILNRQRMSGVVTLSAAQQFLYLQRDRRGYRVYTPQAGEFEPGDVVEVSGFVDPGSGFAVMNHAVVRRKERGRVPDPIPVTRAEVVGYHPALRERLRLEDFDGSLVRLAGRLIKIDNVPQQVQRLYLDHEGATVEARFPTRQPQGALAALPIGAQIEVTAICEVNLTSGWSPPYQPVIDDFGLIVHSAASVRILQQPSWWTVRRLAMLLAFTVLLLAVAMGAVILFRRLALKRSRELAAEVLAREAQERASREAELEFQATLRERERLAADLHDTVEQTLTGVALQLDATRRAPDSGTAGRNLALATQMLARSREDVRRSVWNLRAQALEGQLLRDGLRQIAGSLLDGTGIAVSVGGSGRELALSDVVAGNLLMLAKEAITNALKHAGATRLEIEVDYTETAVTLSIRDNGCGFDVDRVLGPHAGHFGLTGMKERAARLHGEMAIVSKPGAGTTVRIATPLRRGAGG